MRNSWRPPGPPRPTAARAPLDLAGHGVDLAAASFKSLAETRSAALARGRGLVVHHLAARTTSSCRRSTW